MTEWRCFSMLLIQSQPEKGLKLSFCTACLQPENTSTKSTFYAGFENSAVKLFYYQIAVKIYPTQYWYCKPQRLQCDHLGEQ